MGNSAGTVNDARWGMRFVRRQCALFPCYHSWHRQLFVERDCAGHRAGDGWQAHIVKHFGMETLTILDKDPERIRRSTGFENTSLARALKVAWMENQAVRQTMVTQGYGITIADGGENPQ
ncbi:MAG: hypothetical protein R3E39_25785 [Anaerolineae bacterium]